MSSTTKKKPRKRTYIGKPLIVTVSIDANGSVSVSRDPVVVTQPKQRIRWKLDARSNRNWRLDGFCWGDHPPGPGEFHDWVKRSDAISVTDRNKTAGEWKYGLLYNRKRAERHAPSMKFDPMIRNEPLR